MINYLKFGKVGTLAPRAADHPCPQQRYAEKQSVSDFGNFLLFDVKIITPLINRLLEIFTENAVTEKPKYCY